MIDLSKLRGGLPAPSFPAQNLVFTRTIAPRLPASVIQGLTPPARDRTLTVSAENAPIPIVYGEVAVPGLIFAVGTISTDLVVGVAWGYGEFQAIDDIYISDEAVPISGVTVTNYLGTTSQTTDATLAAAIAAFDDDMVLRLPSGDVGIAYSVFRITAAAIDSAPRFQAVVRGRKVYDPRTATTVYSDNSALCWGDLATNPIFGMGVTVSGLAAAANWCDELLGGAVARCRIGLALTQTQRTTGYLALLATYGELIWYWEGSDIVVIPDRAISGYNGPESVENGDFSDGSAWTLGDGWEITGEAYSIEPAAAASLSQTLDLRTGDPVQVSIDVVDYYSGSVSVEIGGVEVIAGKSATGTYTADYTLASDSPLLEIIADASFIGGVDNVSVKTDVYIERNCLSGTLSIEGADDGDTPTKVNVRYTASSSTSGYWADALTSQSLPGVAEGEAPLVESTISLPGITRVEEANNKALARLEQMKNRVSVSWVTTDKGIIHRKGDVIRHKMTTRGTDLLVRVQAVQMVSYGRYRVTGTRYDASHYPSELVLPEGTGTIPVGAILPLSGSTIPAGWEDYTAANGKYILGAGGTYAVGDTGGSATHAGFSGNTSVSDSHDGASLTKFQSITNETGAEFFVFRSQNTSPTAGATHSHTWATGTITPDPFRREQRLVKKTGTADTSIKKEVQVFGLPGLALAGLNRVVSAANRMLYAAAANADAGVASKTLSFTSGSTSNAHDHWTLLDGSSSDLYLNDTWYQRETGGGAHTHAYNLTLSRNPKRKTLSLWGAGADYSIIPGMIILWDDLSSLPTDWVLCDGTGVTPDLRDFFIVIAPEGGEDVAAGDNTISISGNGSSVGHQHRGSSGVSTAKKVQLDHSNTVTHTHSVSDSDSWTPPYYALGAIMYAP